MPFYITLNEIKQCIYKSNISLIESELKAEKNVIIIGDQNADPSRSNPFDEIFNGFVEHYQ